MALTTVLKLANRIIYYLAEDENTHPAVFLIVDKEIGGILINTPEYNELNKENLSKFNINYIFLPSFYGANNLEEWKRFTNAELLAHENESRHIETTIDIPVTEKSKLTRTIDFLPIPGRTSGSCALYLKNLPGIIFFGPILQCNKSGWPDLIQHDDDFNFETRLFSALGLKDLKYQYAFTDDYDPSSSQTGPSAGEKIARNVDQLFE